MRDNAIDMAKRLLIDSIWKSANLEGLGVTFPKTEAILANAPIANTSMEEVTFIVNMKRAWQFLLENLHYPNNLSMLRELNKIAGYALFYNNGEIRNFPVQIGGTTWCPEMPHQAVIMEELHILNTIKDTDIRALKTFCYIARTQMFPDGNKRVAQLMANKILIENNVGIFQIPIEKLEEFKTLLLKFYETNNDEEIIQFMLENCIKYVYRGEQEKQNDKHERTTNFFEK